MNYYKPAFILASACTVLACSPPAPTIPEADLGADNRIVERNILTANRESLGSVFLKDLGVQGTEVTVVLNGLETAGTHAMHFHETGLCNAPDFSSAGGHYNPMNTNHGMIAGGPHAGDMMNIDVDSDGSGSLTVVNQRVSIYGEHQLPALFDEDGSALIIHAKADDYSSQPSGAAGARIGCAVLEDR